MYFLIKNNEKSYLNMGKGGVNKLDHHYFAEKIKSLLSVDGISKLKSINLRHQRAGRVRPGRLIRRTSEAASRSL